ncbi:MAG: pilus assembly protein PilP [Deltaproteobacteria bacterium]|nr:pilus assembly protein PilP [Deltaproteobacteria bacterium]
MRAGKLKYIILAALVPLFMFSCKKEEPKEAEPEKKPAATSPAAAAKPAAEPVQEAKEEDEPGLRRNPFLSHIVLEAGVRKEKKVKGPLECCEAGSFKVIAVVTGLEKSSALVLAPDMKRYIVREGDILGVREGRIVKIDGKGITIREKMLDEDGKAATINDVELRMPSDKSGETLK